MICIKCGRDDAPALIAGKCVKCAEVAPVTGPVLKELRGHHPPETNAKRLKVRLRKARVKGTIYTRSCKWCGVDFKTERKTKVYCCERHKELAANLRNRDQKREQRKESK